MGHKMVTMTTIQPMMVRMMMTTMTMTMMETTTGTATVIRMSWKWDKVLVINSRTCTIATWLSKSITKSPQRGLKCIDKVEEHKDSD